MALVYGTGGDDWIAPDYTSLGVVGLPGVVADEIHGYDGNDYMEGGGGNDTLLGYAGNDIMDGGQGNDSLSGGVGNDWMEGGGGDDIQKGGTGDDVLFGDEGSDELWGGTGEDWLGGGDGNDTLRGGGGNDALYGGGGDDLLAGGSGIDYLVGDDGDDDLNGGGGEDYLEGGDGADYFYFYSPTHGLDIIMDFNREQGDKIAISSTGFDGITTLSLVYSETPNPGQFGYTLQYFYHESIGEIPVTLLYYTPSGGTTHLLAALANSVDLIASDFVLF
ncbi:MAG: hypothetical protein N3D76_11855 [Geminocystis sp.]|nr:hypothetical protein [Geminocystis sp.]